MKERTQTEKFNTGNYAQARTSEPIDKYANRSQMKGTGGIEDHLLKAFQGHKMTLPAQHHQYSHSSRVSPRGAHYHPAGEFGRTERVGAGRGVYGYGGNVRSASSANAVGSPGGRRGGNAVGSPPNRRGSNANMFPHIANRSGHNAVGNPPNRTGENALASRFVPRGGGGGRGA